MTDLPIVLVNDKGEDADGIDYNVEASAAAVQAGFVESVPVLLCYPDGRQVLGQDIRITPKGMGQIRRDVALGAGPQS